MRSSSVTRWKSTSRRPAPSRVVGAGGAQPPQRRGNGGTRSKEQTRAIRDWANSNGYEVSNRGRIPDQVVEAFEAAH